MYQEGHPHGIFSVGDVCQIMGVTPRTLRHYDDIGLLKPVERTESGYRMYDEESLARMRDIIFFRKLLFPLDAIKEILDSPEYDRRETLYQQLRLLEMERDRLNDIINETQRVLSTGGTHYMSYEAFDDRRITEYCEEVRQRWGDTAAYREYERRKAVNSDMQRELSAGMDEIFQHFGGLMRDNVSPCDRPAMGLARELQEFISATCYTCTDEIFASLAVMYTDDERMRANIDKIGGPGTAEYARAAIEAMLKNNR